MSQAVATNRIYAGFQSILRGMNSGVDPQQVQMDQLSFAVNCTMRTNSPKTRPGIAKKVLEFEDEDTQADFQTGIWQGAGTYSWRSIDTSDKSLLLCSISGRIYTIDLRSMSVADITLPGDPNPSIRPMTWFEQGEMFTFIQDGQSVPLIFNGASLRRSNIAAGEMPVGTIMCYGLGRMTVVLPDRRSFIVGNIVGSTEGGTPAYNYRDSIISFTENQYLNGGGVFSAPDRINAVRTIASLDTALNQGPVQFFMSTGSISGNYPFNRDEWFAVTYPLVTGSLTSRGALSQNSTIGINNDIWFRGYDGIRSFQLSRRNFGSWGNTPLSGELKRIFDKDQSDLLQYSSGVLFDNRVLITASPYFVGGRAIAHRGLVATNLTDLSYLTEAGKPPFFDGLWTGLRILQILSLEVDGVERCFIFALDPEDKISLYELTKDDPADNFGQGDDLESRIEGWIETPAYSWGERDTQPPARRRKLITGGDCSISKMRGQIDFSLQYRPDRYPLWLNWQTWSECAEQECVSPWCDDPNLDQYRGPMLFKETPSDCVEINKRQSKWGYTFQGKLSFTGHVQIDDFRLAATD